MQGNGASESWLPSIPDLDGRARRARGAWNARCVRRRCLPKRCARAANQTVSCGYFMETSVTSCRRCRFEDRGKHSAPVAACVGDLVDAGVSQAGGQ